jgi:hypothetical protein
MKTIPAALLFFFCVLGWRSATAQAVGGPISPQEMYCLGRNQPALTAPRARFFNPTPENTEKLLVFGELSLEGLGVYFRQPNYTLRAFRVESNAPMILPSSMYKLFEWRNFTPRKVY